MNGQIPFVTQPSPAITQLAGIRPDWPGMCSVEMPSGEVGFLSSNVGRGGPAV
jgi:hypothetical protein